MQTETKGGRDVLSPLISWREAGAPDLPVAVFLHGLGGNRSSWEPQLEGLRDVRRCLAWDLPGYGRSPGRITTLPALAALAAQWLASLDIGSVDLVGLSFGGMVAQHLALDHPFLVRTLTLLDTSPAFGLDGVTTRESWLAARVDPMRGSGAPLEQVQQVVAGLVGAACPPQVRQEAAASMAAVPGESLAAACRALVDHDTRQRLHEVGVPTLVMVGQEDTETPPSYARAIAERVPGAQLVVVPGAGHLLNLEAPDVVNARLREYWLAANAGRDLP